MAKKKNKYQLDFKSLIIIFLILIIFFLFIKNRSDLFNQKQQLETRIINYSSPTYVLPLPPEVKTFTENNFKFQIQIPSGWKIIKEPDTYGQGKNIFSILPDPMKSSLGEDFGSIEVTLGDEGSVIKQIQAGIDSYNFDFTSDVTDDVRARIISREARNFNGYNSTAIITRIGNRDITDEFIIISNNDLTYKISHFIEKDDLNYKIANQILSTFKFID